MKERRIPCFPQAECLGPNSSGVIVTSNEGEIAHADELVWAIFIKYDISMIRGAHELRAILHRHSVFPALRTLFPDMKEDDPFPCGLGEYPLKIEQSSFNIKGEVFHIFLIKESITPWKINLIQNGFPVEANLPVECAGPLSNGSKFFPELIRRISFLYNVAVSVRMVTARCQTGDRHVNLIQTLSFVDETGQYKECDAYPDEGKPCRVVLESNRKDDYYRIFRTRGILDRLFPHEKWIKDQNLEFFMGMPLIDKEKPVGHFIITGSTLLPRAREKELGAVLYHFQPSVCRALAHVTMDEVKNQLHAMIEGAVQAIVTIGEYGNVLSVNPAMERMLGFPPDEIIGYNINKIMPQPEKGRHQGYLEGYATTGISKIIGVGREVVGKKKDGTLIPLHLAVSESFTKRSRIYTGILTDMTKSQAEKDQLHQEKELALSTAEAKAEFLSHMSHEIRTPMNGVIGMIDLLLETELTPDQRDYAETVQSSGIDLIRIINDILDFSKIEAGKVVLESIDFDPRLCLENIGELLAPAAHEKGIEVAVLIFHNFPRTLKGDPGRLRQVLLNLLNNALKFTERGEIGIRAELLSQSQKVARVRFAVTDTGPGIPADKVTTLFESFAQEDTSTTRKYGGTGLGLTICKQLVELMEGRIQVKSEVGRGSEFSFEVSLPVVSEKRKPREYDETLLRDARIVLVAGHQTHLQVLQEDLVTLGCQYIATFSDIEALANHFRENEADVLLFENISSPFSLEVVTDLLGRLTLTNPPKIIYLTPQGLPGDAKEKQSMGIAAYLSKPVTHDHLCKALLTVLDPNYQETAPLVTSHSLNEYHLQGHRILVAEDHPTNQKLIVTYLQKWGYEVDLASNGREALTAFKENDYDLVLMDCQMPEVDGFEATKQIRAEERNRKTPSVPILALTANATRVDADRCIEAGMNAHIGKPLDPQQLRTILFKHLSPHEEAPIGIRREQLEPLESLLMYPEDIAEEKDVAEISLDVCEVILEHAEQILELQKLSSYFRDLVNNFEEWSGTRRKKQLEDISNQWQEVLSICEDSPNSTRNLYADSDQLYALRLYLDSGRISQEELITLFAKCQEVGSVSRESAQTLGNIAHNLKSSFKSVRDLKFQDLWEATEAIEMACSKYTMDIEVNNFDNHKIVELIPAVARKMEYTSMRFPKWAAAMEEQISRAQGESSSN